MSKLRSFLLATCVVLVGGACGTSLRPSMNPSAATVGAAQASAATPGAPGAAALTVAGITSAGAPDLTARMGPVALRKAPFIGLTVSGGVSLGAYEAGFLYYLSEVARLPGNQKAIDLHLVTGASAGNINALLTILALCGRPEPNPQRSVFWKTWIGIGSRTLFKPPSPDDPPETGERGAFSHASLLRISSQVEPAWMAGIDARCDKVLAVSATRKRSAEVNLQDGFKVPRQEEKFVIRIQGQGYGRAPKVSNYVDPNSALPQPMLPFPTDQTTLDGQLKTFALVRDLLLASAAFPVAFPPQPLPHCLTPGTRKVASTAPGPAVSVSTNQNVTSPSSPNVTTECGDQTVLTEDFIDGGVFDNTPLRLAEHLTEYLSPAGEWRDLRDPPKPGDARYQGGFFFIDPDTAAYPAPPEVGAAYKLPFLTQISSFLTSFIATARSKELYTLIQEKPDIDVALARRHFPTASGHLANFFGFFEESFRRFDFYLGMYDAHRMALKSLPVVADMSRPESPEAVWDPFVCMASVYADDDHDQKSCTPDPTDCARLGREDCARKTRHAAAFRALLQVSIDRLYSHCEELPPATMPSIDHHHCLRAALHKPRRIVQNLPGNNDASAFRRRPDEDHFRHTLRLLDRYHFRYEDLLGPDDDGDSVEAMTRVRFQLATLIERMAKEQPFGDALVLRALGKPALNFIYYSPPPTILYLSLGRGNELGGSFLSGWGRRLRYNLALQSKGLEELAFADNGAAAFTPLLGLEYEFNANAIAQSRIGLRGGYQISTKGPKPGDCRITGPSNSFSASRSDCSAFVAQLPLSLTVLERIRFQIVPEYLVPYSPVEGKSWNILFGVGGQLISPF